MVSHTMCKTLKGEEKKRMMVLCYNAKVKKFVSRMLLVKIKAVLHTNFLITNCLSLLVCVLNTL